MGKVKHHKSIWAHSTEIFQIFLLVQPSLLLVWPTPAFNIQSIASPRSELSLVKVPPPLWNVTSALINDVLRCCYYMKPKHTECQRCHLVWETYLAANLWRALCKSCDDTVKDVKNNSCQTQFNKNTFVNESRIWELIISELQQRKTSEWQTWGTLCPKLKLHRWWHTSSQVLCGTERSSLRSSAKREIIISQRKWQRHQNTQVFGEALLQWRAL